jgi:hypothetical protein
MTAEDIVNFLEVKGLIFPNDKERLRAKNSLVEFAKYHVEEASKTTKWKEQITMQGLQITIIKSSILNAYPTNLIK